MSGRGAGRDRGAAGPTGATGAAGPSGPPGTSDAAGVTGPPPPRGPRTPDGRGLASEERQGLWLVAAPPTVWAAHFLVCYVGAAVWCARVVGRDGALGPVRPAIAAVTVLALAAIGLLFWTGLRRERLGEGEAPHGEDTPEGRTRFLGFAAMLLSALSAVAVIYVGAVALFVETCR